MAERRDSNKIVLGEDRYTRETAEATPNGALITCSWKVLDLEDDDIELTHAQIDALHEWSLRVRHQDGRNA